MRRGIKMGTGYLRVETRTANEALPIVAARVIIMEPKGGEVLYRLLTNENGMSQKVALYAPDAKYSFDPEYEGEVYSTYDVEITMNGFIPNIIRGVQVFDGEVAILPVTMAPQLGESVGGPFIREINIPPIALREAAQRNQQAPPSGTPLVLAEVIIPEHLTVHLGPPASSAPNVRVKFTDYIKNVASHEIYADWPVAALEANIYAQISYTLNRIYTEWYRSQGYNFDITSSTTVDQKYVDGGNIFENISRIVDRMFNRFIRREGRREPFFAQYCDGRQTQCNGLSQWGSLAYAQQGLNAFEILRRFYPSDIQLVESYNIQSITESFPGVLRQGNTGSSVLRMQRYLNRISSNFWIPPGIANPNGVFGADTTETVRMFQRSQNLVEDGIVGRATWYRISFVYVAVTNLASLESEGERIGIGTNPPTSVLRVGSRGADVVELQFILNFISEFYRIIPSVTQTGVFNEQTRLAVIEFQRFFELTPDGVVGPMTWNKLYEIFRDVDGTIIVPPAPPGTIPPAPPVTPPPPSIISPPFPGTLLRVGSRGSDVMLMQEYLNLIGTLNPTIPRLTVDGIFGNATESAVIEFQKIFGLQADGIIGPATWNRVVEEYNRINQSISPPPPSIVGPPFPGTLLRVGSRGSDVMLMQRYLNLISTVNPSIPRLAVDGIFGNGTEAAVMEFQKIFGLQADGIIGPVTWRRIVEEYNRIDQGATTPPPPAPPAQNRPPFPGTLLRVGSRGNDVMLMQRYLNAIRSRHPSIPLLTVDGVFGNRTEAAVREFQRISGLQADGIIGPITWNRIVDEYNIAGQGSTNRPYPGNLLRVGSRGRDVSFMQECLNVIKQANASMPLLVVDGIFGSRTESAVKEFQRMCGLQVDGVIGPITWNRIMSEYDKVQNGDTSEYPYPGAELRMGSRGNNVKMMQQYLNVIRREYVHIPAIVEDGIFGKTTEVAVIEFQRTFGLTPDGIIGAMTWDSITKEHDRIKGNETMPMPYYHITDSKSSDMSDENIKSLQNHLNSLSTVYHSLPKLEVDGVFGSITKEALITFQKLFSHTPDGILAEKVLKAVIKEVKNIHQ